MTITYHVVDHDEGWAYRLGDVYSEPFATREAALEAARSAAARHELPAGEDRFISYQTADGTWHNEVAGGSDRPEAGVDGAGGLEQE